MDLTRSPDVAVPKNRFLPADFDAADPAAIEGSVKELLERPIGSPAELAEWIVARGEIQSAIQGEWTRRFSAMNRDTSCSVRKAAFQTLQEEVAPVWEKLSNELDKRYLACEQRAGLGAKYAVHDRELVRDAEIYREENTALGIEDRKLGAEFQEIQGGLSVQLDGETMTAPQAGARTMWLDREKRREAFHALVEARSENREAIHAIYDRLIALRDESARNAGFENYLGFRFAQMSRFDYTPEDCEGFHAAVEKVVVPELEKARDMRARVLGIDTVRPYDLYVNLFGADEGKLFETEDEYIALVRRFFRSIDPSFDEDFDVLVRNGLLDLMSRPNKAPGAYNAPVSDIRLPFIFGNAVGMQYDVQMLLHEGGHAFHTIACRPIEIADYRRSTPEFSEVASMSMELFGVERMPEVYGEERARRYAFGVLDNALMQFGNIATGDAFQHWVYRNPGHTHAERDEKWVELTERFMPGVDWTGYEQARLLSWQRIPHFFTHPLYFIDYGIAQLGALQLWLNERRDHPGAIAAYRHALSLGGSRPLPELYKAAGIRFAMDEPIFREVLPALTTRLTELAP